MNIPESEADVIIAAGDIGIYKQGLTWLKGAQKPVIYVAGNHEFYGHEYFDTIGLLNSMSANTNVHFLENQSIEINNVRFIGCTFWSNLGGEENDRTEELLTSINDFKKIYYKKNLLEIENYTEIHQNSRRWLIAELEKPFTGKTVVVSHHAPTIWSWNNSPTSLTRFAYCNDVREVIHKYDIAAWVHGHTHSISDYTCAGASVLCNPRGYTGRKMVEGFDPAKTFEI